MKTIAATLALVLLVATPTFAAGSHGRHLQEGRTSAYAPQVSGYYVGSDYSGREAMIHAN